MNKRILKKIVFLLIASLSLFFATVTHVAAQAAPFYWENINVTIDVQTNGDMLVTETQKYVFTGNYTNQRSRYIPLDKVGEIKDVTVAENNQIIASTTGIENNQIWIRWQHELKPPESHTFVVKYRVVGGLQVNGENTQVYWKAIWPDRKSPINASQVTVKLPDVLVAKVSSFKSFGIPTTVRQLDGQTFAFTGKQALPPKQELEVQVIFPTGILQFSTPSPQASNNSGFTIDGSSPLGGFLGFIVGSIIFVVFTSPIWIPVLLLMKVWSFFRKKCPSCKKPTLIRKTKVISSPTRSNHGEDQIICHCDSCGYHDEKTVVTTYTDPSSSSDSYSGGGGDSGGGDSGGGGGGGGD
ncbi:DUF2207 domain-containing protein [Microcoleus sp. CAWBG640]|uniref:DUF2207 domain-containing protein n=1 Tax=Microcoleus sp. CAWBG640 TaxID=2841653 RepID=UPI00312B4281